MTVRATIPIRERWLCSACGRTNSMVHDNVCWYCMEQALDEDAEKLRASGEEACAAKEGK